MERVGALLAGGPAAGLAGGLGVTVCAAAGGVLLYKIARRKKPTHMTVNCWFCNQDTVVPYGNRNCWDCPNCEQYNGFQENGDYNKPIPAQYMEHLNHVVSGAGASYDPTKPQQWVSSQLLLCKKCNNHQTLKIKQLASFSPREEGKYDEEIEVYKHHLEQTYKLCRPCQAAVEYYIKHQNRQLRALLLRHHFSLRKTDKPYMQSFYAAASASTTTPVPVIALRFLAFLSCAVLIVMALYGSANPFSPELGTPSAPSSNGMANEAANGTRPGPPPTAATHSNNTLLELLAWQEVVQLLPEQVLETLKAAWAYGKTHQTGVVVLGLLTCCLAMMLAGRIRLRRIDAFASVLWLLVMGFHLAENYLQADTPSWLDTAKFGTTSLCCLIGFAAAVATRKPTGQRRPRPRRYLSGDTVTTFPTGAEIGFPYPPMSPSVFIPTPPGVLQLTNQQLFRSPRRTSSSSLPGRLNRALSLGTIPSLARTGAVMESVPLQSPISEVSGSKRNQAGECKPCPVAMCSCSTPKVPFGLSSEKSQNEALQKHRSCLRDCIGDGSEVPGYSGSRPPSQTSHSRESPSSEYFSLLSGSCVPSPVPSPAPSVAGSVTSSSGSLRYRRPLISPARLNLKGQRLLLFPSQSEAQVGEEHTHAENVLFTSDLAAFSKRNLGDQGMQDVRAIIEAGSIYSNNSMKRGNDSSHSSSCVVDTTTKGEELAGWRGRFGHSSIRGLLAISLTVNAIFTSAYLYQSLR